jgi:PEP-CTERM motif
MKLRALFTAVAATTVAWATPSLATTITVTSAPFAPGSMWGGVTVGTPALSTGLEAGRFQFSGFQTSSPAVLFSQSTYCVDLFTGLYTSTNFDILALSAVVPTIDRQNRIAGLLVNSATLFAAATTDAQRNLIGAATQVSVWELVYETVGGPLTVSSGNFSVFGDFVPNVSVLANSYLANNWMASPTLVSSLVSVNRQSQNQIFLNAPAVPEPATWLSMLFGFGIVGGAMRRTKLRKAVTA